MSIFLLLAVVCLSDNFVKANQQSVRMLNQNHLGQRGIYDRVVQKLQQKEEAQKKYVQEQVSQQLLMQQQDQMNTQREILLNSPYPSNLEGDLQDVQQAIKEINTNGKPQAKKLSYEEQIAQIAKQQDEENSKFSDDYEGFGSLTEMIKNKDKIAEVKAKEEVVVIESKKKQEEDRKALLEKARAKMTAALDKDAQARKIKEAEEAANKKKLVKKPPAIFKDNSFIGISSTNKLSKRAAISTVKKTIKKAVPVKKLVKPAAPIKKKLSSVHSSLAQKLALKLAKKSDTSKASPMKSSQLASPAPFIDGPTPSSAQLVSLSSTEGQAQEQEEKPQDKSTNKTKLYDATLVDHVIDEVQTEQEEKIEERKYKQSLPQKQEEKEEEQGGYLSNFRKKFSNLKESEDSDNQQVQVASQVDTTQENVKTAHKGIMERFNDKINEDVSDQEKTNEIISTVQRHLTREPKQSLLDRESERLIREQDEELANDDELAQQQQ